MFISEPTSVGLYANDKEGVASRRRMSVIALVCVVVVQTTQPCDAFFAARLAMPRSRQSAINSRIRWHADNTDSSCLLQEKRSIFTLEASSETGGEQAVIKAPTFNGKVVYPVKVFLAGLKGHKVAATYAVMNNSYKRGCVVFFC
jgi:hypothetical protein